jgi:hypothetical protein
MRFPGITFLKMPLGKEAIVLQISLADYYPSSPSRRIHLLAIVHPAPVIGKGGESNA